MADMTIDDAVLVVEALTDSYREASGALLAELNDSGRQYSPWMRSQMTEAYRRIKQQRR